MKKQKLKDFAAVFMRRFKGAEVNTTSVLIAYYLLLSLFPLLILIGNILPFFNIDPAATLEYIELLLPDVVQPVLGPIITGLLTSSNGGLLSISALGAIWASSRGINYLQKAMNKAYGVPDTNLIAKRLISLVTILLVLLLLVAFVLLFSLGEMLLQALAPALPWAAWLLSGLLGFKWPAAILFLFLLLVLVYRVTPDVKLKVRGVLPGAALGTAGLLILAQAFTWYIRFSTRSFSSYGALGTFFVLMFWLNFSMMIVIVGAVLNAALAEHRSGQPAQAEAGRVDAVLDKTRESLRQRLRRLFKKKPR